MEFAIELLVVQNRRLDDEMSICTYDITVLVALVILADTEGAQNIQRNDFSTRAARSGQWYLMSISSGTRKLVVGFMQEICLATLFDHLHSWRLQLKTHRIIAPLRHKIFSLPAWTPRS